MPIPRNDVEAALLTFVECVNATGGLVWWRNHKGMRVRGPVADREWTDLADAYVQACAALGVEPKLDPEEPA